MTGIDTNLTYNRTALLCFYIIISSRFIYYETSVDDIQTDFIKCDIDDQAETEQKDYNGLINMNNVQPFNCVISQSQDMLV